MTSNRQLVDVYTLRNSKGMEAQISNYGGIVVS
jgi:galactose mutarotase-like enzyme